MKKNQKYVLLVLISSILLVLLFTGYFLYQKYSTTDQSQQILTEINSEEEASNVFPLFTLESMGYFYAFDCVIETLENVDTKFQFGPGDYDYLQLKLLANCEYIDADKKTQSVMVPLGAIKETEEGYFWGFANRSRPYVMRDDPNLYTGEVMKFKIEEYFQVQLNEERNLSVNDVLRVFISKPDNQIVQELASDNLSHSSEFIYADSGFSNILSDSNFDTFIETGNPNVLPDLPDGRKIIPTHRVEYIVDN